MVSLERLHPQVCWERSVETLTARKDDIAGLAVASDERIEAYLLYVKRRSASEAEIVSLRSFIEDGGARLKQLLARLRARGMETFRFPKVHPAEISKERLETLGFRPRRASTLRSAGARLRNAVTLRSHSRAMRAVTSPPRIVRAGSSLSGPTNVRADVGVTPRLPPG